MTDTSSSTTIDPAEHFGLVLSVVQQFRSPDHQDFDDLAQEAAVGLVEAAKEFDPSRGAWSTVAYLLVRRAAVGYLRSRRSRRAGEPFSEGAEAEVPAPDQADAVEREEERAKLEQALTRLPRKDREMVRLFFGLGTEKLLLHAIAKKFRVSKQRVSQRVQRALKLLRGMLEESTAGSVSRCG